MWAPPPLLADPNVVWAPPPLLAPPKVVLDALRVPNAGPDLEEGVGGAGAPNPNGFALDRGADGACAPNPGDADLGAWAPNPDDGAPNTGAAALLDWNGLEGAPP